MPKQAPPPPHNCRFSHWVEPGLRFAGKPCYFNFSGFLVDLSRTRIDGEGRPTQTRGKPGRGFTARGGVNTDQASKAAARAAAWAGPPKGGGGRGGATGGCPEFGTSYLASGGGATGCGAWASWSGGASGAGAGFARGDGGNATGGQGGAITIHASPQPTDWATMGPPPHPTAEVASENRWPSPQQHHQPPPCKAVQKTEPKAACPTAVVDLLD